MLCRQSLHLLLHTPFWWLWNRAPFHHYWILCECHSLQSKRSRKAKWETQHACSSKTCSTCLWENKASVVRSVNQAGSHACNCRLAYAQILLRDIDPFIFLEINNLVIIYSLIYSALLCFRAKIDIWKEQSLKLNKKMHFLSQLFNAFFISILEFYLCCRYPELCIYIYIH